MGALKKNAYINIKLCRPIFYPFAQKTFFEGICIKFCMTLLTLLTVPNLMSIGSAVFILLGSFFGFSLRKEKSSLTQIQCVSRRHCAVFELNLLTYLQSVNYHLACDIEK